MKPTVNRDELINSFLRGGQVAHKEGGEIHKTTNHLDDSYLDEFMPLEVKVYGNNFEKSFKAFRTMVQKDRILSLYKANQSYEKPSEKKRRKANEQRQKRMELEARNQKILSGEFEKELQKKLKLKELKKQLREERNRGGQ